MKLIVLLTGLAALFITSGCEHEEHEHHGRGGAYDGYYQGHGEYHHFDRDRDFDDHWEHR